MWFKRAQKKADFGDAVKEVLGIHRSQKFSEAQFDEAMRQGAQVRHIEMIDYDFGASTVLIAKCCTLVSTRY